MKFCIARNYAARFGELSEALDAMLDESKTKIGTMIEEADIKMKKGIDDQRQEFDRIVQEVSDAKAFRERQEQDMDKKVQDLGKDADEFVSTQKLYQQTRQGNATAVLHSVADLLDRMKRERAAVINEATQKADASSGS